MEIVCDIETQRQTVLPNDIIDHLLYFLYKLKIQHMLAKCKSMWTNTIHHMYGKKIYYILVNTLENGPQHFDIETNILRFHDLKRKDSYVTFLMSSMCKKDLNIEFHFEGYTFVLVPFSHFFTQCNIFIIPHPQTKKQIPHHIHGENPLYLKLRFIWRNFIYFLLLVKHKLGILRKRERVYTHLTEMLQELLYLFLFRPDQVLTKMNITFVDHVGDANLFKRMMKSIMNVFKDASLVSHAQLFKSFAPNSKV